MGHLVARKRHEDVLRAVALIRQVFPDIRYVIVGDGPQRETLGALITDLGLQGNVELRGALPHEQAVAVARAATLFVMPSVDEAFGVAYVEAMAAGVPAIGCEGEAGPLEIIRAGGGIELVAAGDVNGLARTIERLIGDRDERAALRTTARETVAREFTWQACGRATVSAYDEALRSAPRRGGGAALPAELEVRGSRSREPVVSAPAFRAVCGGQPPGPAQRTRCARAQLRAHARARTRAALRRVAEAIRTRPVRRCGLASGPPSVSRARVRTGCGRR